MNTTSTRLRQLADRMGLDGFAEELREIAGELEAPASTQDEPFGYFRAEPMGWTDCAATDEGAVALYEAPPDVASLRKELESANDFIKSLADVCQKYEELLGYRKTNAPEGASELAEAKGESSLNTELDLACANSTCQHDFALDPKSSIRICLKCGTPERRAMKPTPAAPSQPAVPQGIPAHEVIDAIEAWKSAWAKVPPFGNKVNKATREAITFSHNTLFQLLWSAQQAQRMPKACPTPTGCGPHGCHGACITAAPSQPAVPDADELESVLERLIERCSTDQLLCNDDAVIHAEATLERIYKSHQYTHTPAAPSQEPAVPQGWTDADSDAARLALELECLLLDTETLSVVSKWWASANEALELHRRRLATLAATSSQPVTLTDEEIKRNWSGGACPPWGIKFARAIIAALREKERG